MTRAGGGHGPRLRRALLWAAAVACADAAPPPAGASGAPARTGRNVTLLQRQLRSRLPQNPQLGAQYVKDAQSYAWRVQGEATEARAYSHEIIAKGTQARTEANAGKAAAARAAQAGFHEGVDFERAGAAAAAQEARDWQAKAQGVLDETYDKAFAASKAAAEAKVAEMEADAKAYYDELVANFYANAEPKPDPKAAAAAAAAQPYLDVETQTIEVMKKYNKYIKKLIGGAKGCVKLAFKLANGANRDQSVGKWEIAQRKMLFAHQLIGKANKMEGAAKRVYKLAKSINKIIPSYPQAAEMAALNVVDNWGDSKYGISLITMGGGLPKKNPFGAKQEGEPYSATSMVLGEKRNTKIHLPFMVPSKKDVEDVSHDLSSVGQSLTSLDTSLSDLDNRLAGLRDQAASDTHAALAVAEDRFGALEKRLHRDSLSLSRNATNATAAAPRGAAGHPNATAAAPRGAAGHR